MSQGKRKNNCASCIVDSPIPLKTDCRSWTNCEYCHADVDNYDSFPQRHNTRWGFHNDTKDMYYVLVTKIECNEYDTNVHRASKYSLW
jgi:hypothetical protein